MLYYGNKKDTRDSVFSYFKLYLWCIYQEQHTFRGACRDSVFFYLIAMGLFKAYPVSVFSTKTFVL